MNKSQSPPLIVIVEDDLEISRLTTLLLESEGFHCQSVNNGKDAEALIKKCDPALVILDVMLPGQSGIEVCKSVRPFYQGAILMLTGCDDDITQLSSFKQGADDYVIKPIKPHLLLARINALLNRTLPRSKEKMKRYDFGSLTIDCKRREVSIAGEIIDVPSSEFDILALLSQKAGEVVSRTECCENLRGLAYDGLDRSIDMRISSLRKKLAKFPEHEKRIITVRTRGYMLVQD
ncbi:response regulator transcription factor [Aliikangiella coralliicola]|uniref:Response regulator transcription factor n=1 Tax=Aliikangiella coralliicola TaxID=2592383 RepID=A0A545UCU9_9GAMM|nr:response regulator transcription factor [Aliikangiella coralliicola]TQV87294.1 response regulator transcription factor [Aliikangiella coralliicola]